MQGQVVWSPMTKAFRRIVGTGILAALVGCAPAPSAEPTSAAVSTSSPAPTASIRPSLPPSPIPTLDVDELPVFELEDSGATGICDNEPGGALNSRFLCYDTLRYGLRILRTEMPGVDRIYLSRQTCADPPCGANEVAVIGWLADDAYTVYFDENRYAGTVPTLGASATWPSATSSAIPGVDRPVIENAAREMREREPYPFCGRAKPIGLRGEDAEDVERTFAINRCFFDAILEGRPAEMIVITDVTRQPALFRFAGQGPVIRYLEETEGPISKRGWYRAEGPVILGRSVYHGHAFNLSPVLVD